MLNRKILLGITGGIAAYKTPELIRMLTKSGAQVRVVMTDAATRFVTPTTLQTVSGEPVSLSLWQSDTDAMEHIALARWADLILVAPATADFIAQLAHGFAADLLTTICLATRAPLYVAPAMNQQMWSNVATQTNCQLLQSRGIKFIGPDAGEQACGEIGPGRMSEIQALVAALGETAALLAGLRVMITAGPTREPIDPVRYLTNRSSGKMGYALAQAAHEQGAQVTLISGPVAIDPPAGVQLIAVETAQQMHAQVMAGLPAVDVFIGSAAVADYRIAQPATQKIKKSEQALNLSLQLNPDILASVAQSEHAPFTVGFAAETHQLERFAEQKRRSKQVDMIAANLVGKQDIGFETDYNALSVYWEGGGQEIPKAPKSEIARMLIQLIAQRIQVASVKNGHKNA